MRTLYLFLTILVLSSFHFDKGVSKFEKFKTGKFTYKGMEGQVEIIRTSSKQTEIFNNGKSKLILKIDWPNDSTYVLTYIKDINSPGCLKKGDEIISTILSVHGNECTVKYTSKNCGKGQSVFVKLD